MGYIHTCKHTRLTGTQGLERCPSCQEWFVVKLQTIIAASNQPEVHFPLVALYAYPSNFLGHTCGNETVLRRLS